MSEPESDLAIAAITDAKSLYDNLVREQYSGTENVQPWKFVLLGTHWNLWVGALGGYHTKKIQWTV